MSAGEPFRRYAESQRPLDLVIALDKVYESGAPMPEPLYRELRRVLFERANADQTAGFLPAHACVAIAGDFNTSVGCLQFIGAHVQLLRH